MTWMELEDAMLNEVSEEIKVLDYFTHRPKQEISSFPMGTDLRHDQ